MDTPPPEDDGDFEVTADMLIHDTIDDETTLEEEEAMRTREEDAAELNELQEEGDMPLEKLLSLYGYGPPTTTATDASQETTSKTSHTHTNKDHTSPTKPSVPPGSSMRSRRRNRVVPLQPQKIPSPEASGDHTPSSPNKGLSERTSGAETLKNSAAQSGSTPQSSTSHSGTGAQSSQKTASHSGTGTEELSLRGGEKMASTTSKGTSKEVQQLDKGGQKVKQGASKGREQQAMLHEIPRLKGSELTPTKQEAKRVELGKRKWEGQEDTDGEDVDVVEVGEVNFDLARVEEEETVLSLDEFQRAEFDVVQMGDIEAGLRIEGGALGELEEVGLSEGVEAFVGVGQEEEEEEEGEEEEEQDNAVYDDVLLSSGSARLLSDTTDVPTLAVGAPSVQTDTDARAYIRGSRLRPEIPERRSMRLMNSDDKALLYFSVLSDGSGSDSDEPYSPQEDWKKEPKLGESHQALVPDYAPTTPYPTTAAKAGDTLMWSPRGISDEQVSAYLQAVSQIVEGVSSDPKKDHEKALEVLQHCNHNVNTALFKMQTQVTEFEGMKPWTEDECRRFEDGLRAVRKDFFHLQRKVPTRSVKEVVEFYYLWKKTERYDHFIEQYGKVGRKKTIIPPGHVSDFMDKYLDMHGSDSAMDIHYLTTTTQAEMKRDN